MGEYTKIKKTKENIKIGSCVSMYYLRYEDAPLVEYFDGGKSKRYDDTKTKGFLFRAPHCDELSMSVGEYGEEYNRGYPLPNFELDECMRNTLGTLQLEHEEAGIVVNLPCCHGGDLADCGEIKPFYRGRAEWFIELAFIKHHDDGLLYPIIKCRFCEKLWRCDWEEVLPFINDDEIIERLQHYILRNEESKINN